MTLAEENKMIAIAQEYSFTVCDASRACPLNDRLRIEVILLQPTMYGLSRYFIITPPYSPTEVGGTP